MVATISIDIHSNGAIHGNTSSNYYPPQIAETIRRMDFITYRVGTCQNTQSALKILYQFESANRTNKVSWYVNRMDVNGNRDNIGQIAEANWPQMRCHSNNENIQNWQRQSVEATRPGKYTQI